MEVCRRVCWRELLVFLHLMACAVGMPGRCSLFGRHYVHTFDGVLYDFPGDCSYLLAGDCNHRSFTLLGDFVHGRRSGVTLFLGDVFELHLSVDGTLSQGEKRISLPYASHAVFVGAEMGSYKLWSEEFGFTVTIDSAANVAVTLAKHHTNRTCGLCGNFNSLSVDDYTAQEGFLTEDSYDFANSWAVKGAGQACRRVVPPNRLCNSTKETSAFLSSCSLLQTSSVFLHCAHIVSPEAFQLVCEEEACHCGQREGPDCYCPILLEYARTCHAHGMLLHGWLEESNCSPKCPIGMQYSECSRSCSTTCQSLNIQEVCKDECVDGCMCPVGKVLDGGHCVEVSQCSCVHRGRHFPPGSSIAQDCNTCVCRHGSWECTNEGCPGECLVMGQSHFKTFDNKFFTFTGQCQYLLARDCEESQFSVIIENVQCADDQDAVCTRSVTLSLHSLEDMKVKLKHGGMVSVNDMDIQTPMHYGRLRIQRSVQSSVRVKFREDFRLDWDGRGRVLLKLGPAWAGRTCGLCGNYNGNQGDDFLSGAGLVEAGPLAFGLSWGINGDCESHHRSEIDPCTINPKRVRFAKEACSALMSEAFSPCHFLVNPGPFQRFCHYDVCACVDGEECLCSALSSYVAACSARGVLLNWRSPSLCELRCTGGQSYEACASVCDRTCRSLSGAEAGCEGERICDEGCFCPLGQYLSDSGECVTADHCTCLHDGQLYQPNDVYADHNSICYCLNGSMHCSSNEMGNAMLSDLFYDDDFTPARDRRSVPCPPPLMRVECDAGEKGLECARTCQNLDLPCLSLACIPGCLCPPGTVRHLRECIAPEQCPCYHNNRPHASGQTISVDCNTCVCENRKWRCTEKVCDGVCRTVGEGHYITFDGLMYSFPGLCQYVLAQDMCDGEDGSFRVLVENEACGIVGHRCAKAVTVFYQGGLITMQHGEVKMRRPVRQGSEVEIIHSGQFYILLLGKHISISWDQSTRLLLHISAKYRGRVCGLCGNFDGNVNNDLMSSNNQLEIDSNHVGNSWKVKPSCADVTQLPTPCSDNLVKQVTVEQSCRVLTGPLFKECNSQVDAEQYVEMCVEAACSCPSVGDCVCFCDVVAAYAQACSERGVSISWRSNDLCPMSCDELNTRGSSVGEELCQWRYNACGSACQITCQHPEPLHCPLTCVEGCHASCPHGQLLDEVAMHCVDPSQCKVCIHEGQRISHGNKVILNHDNPEHCKICHCEDNVLSCEVCNHSDMFSTHAPTSPPITSTAPPFSTMMPTGTCDRAMDLAFLLDGSAALGEDEFEKVKEFILAVVERFRMGSAHTRATVLLFHSGVKTYDLQVQKWLFKKTVHELHYTGGNAAFLDEAVKYLAINIYDKNKREHAGRVAIILTASANPRPMRATVKMLRKKTITTLSVALGPGANLGQINEITKANPENRAYVLSSTGELPDRLLELSDYLCTLGLEPEGAKPVPTKPTQVKPVRSTTTTVQPATLEPNPTQQFSSSPTPTLPAGQSPVTTSPSSNPAAKDVTFILEGSDSVGEVNFNKSLYFLEEVISKLSEQEESIRITVIQYSVTITVEISRLEVRRQKTLLIQRLREIRWRGGSKTNTGAAVTTSLQQITTTKPAPGPTASKLVFLVTENPPTDTVTRPPATDTQTHIYPIGVGPKVRENDLMDLSFPRRPLMVDDYNRLRSLVHQVVNITHNTIRPRFPTLQPPFLQTLSPRTTLPPSVPCKKPMDVVFLLKAGEEFEDMKTFVKAFINSANTGRNDTQVGVVQYGDGSTAEVTWKDEQSKPHLLNLVDDMHSRTSAAPALGSALRFAVQTSISPASGGRAGVAKVVVMLVTDRSTDDVQEASNEALVAGVSVFPIGVGPGYDRTELNALSGRRDQDHTLHLSSMDQLRMLLTLDHGYTERLCRAGPGSCVDDSGTERKPGESWLLEDGCHSLLCHPSGAVTVQNHKVNCDRLELPACRNNMMPVKVQESCGCHWECPCMCMGTSTNHVVRFDGMALRLDGEGVCSYTLLTVAKGSGTGSEVKLHSGPCQASATDHTICMKTMEVTHGDHKLLLKDDMTAVLDGEVLSLPWHYGGLEVLRYGGVMLQLKSEHGYVLTFTPQSNEFTITQLSSTTASHTAGLCGACGEEKVNKFSLRNGSLTADQQAFISDWTVAEEGGVCLPRPKAVCVSGAAFGCQALRSEVFDPCHAHVPIQVFLAKCEEQACEEADVCELISAYARLCRQRGICVDWRSPHLCPFPCPGSMEYDACRSGCVEDCSTARALPGDWTVARGNESLCMDTPTEGCFCPGGTVLHHRECVSPEACSQCVDRHGQTHAHMMSWVPKDNPCLICMCLDQQQINCTTRPCNDVKAPACGPCEILREKRGSKCCPEYECVCDLVSCNLPEVPRCEDGQTVVLKNPGECQPMYECVCKQEECELQAASAPACPAHRRLSVKKTQCCSVFECACSCQNSTRSCPPGFIPSTSSNDCGCTETSCLPDKVCVVGGVVYPVGSQWEEKCQKCSCTQLQDSHMSLHIAQCTPPVCDQTCPLGSSYRPSEGECCGKCRKDSCVESESEGPMPGDTLRGERLRYVGEVWQSPGDKCVSHKCVRANDEVLIASSNVSCPPMDNPACPLGTELRCDMLDCCPHCSCAPMDACVLNHTVIGAGERLMLDVCTHCECSVENGAVRKYRLACRKIRCPVCPEGYSLEQEPDACCGRCVPTACILQRPNGRITHLQVNTTDVDGCSRYTCSTNDKGDLVLQTKVTICPPFDRQACLDKGGKVSQMGTSCCEMCTEPECIKTAGMLNYIKVDDCQSEHQIELQYCEGRCSSKSMYSLESGSVEQKCVCCAAVETEPLHVPILCTNGTRTHHTVLSVTACDCLSKHCT
ncbi:von Willebrand factor isoform X2 [Lampris incognitus]|uniref:von Willebrand factor isoform X2 n=1 Tax=Lampris incognitus TaxID=2546036 RepID=UPI0024B507CC|nr:von Willebrand factor isoform X2 [Lampris incognitus]